jgi:hypothetical protein
VAFRTYVEWGSTPAVSPAFSSEWDDTDDMTRINGSDTPSGSALVSHTFDEPSGVATSDLDYGALQIIVGPLPAHEYTTSDTIKGRFLVMEAVAGVNARSQFIARVLDDDGSTYIGTLYGGDLTTGTANPTSEWGIATNGLVARQMPRGSSVAVQNNVSAPDNHYLVYEVGARLHNVQTNARVLTIQVGDDIAYADIPENETATSGLPWIEGSWTYVLTGSDPATGTVIGTDDFTDTDDVYLDNHDTTWDVSVSNYWQIKANRVHLVGSGAWEARWENPPVSDDYDVRADVTALTDDNNSGMGVAARLAADISSLPDCYATSTDVYYNQHRLLKFQGDNTYVVATATYTHTTQTTFAHELRVRGSEIEFWLDGSLLLSTTDSTIPSGHAGLFAEYASGPATGVHLDNWEAQDVAVGATTATRTITASMTVSVVNQTRAIAPTVAIKVTDRTRTVAASASVSVINQTRTIAGSVAIATTHARTIAADASIDAGLVNVERTIVATASIRTQYWHPMAYTDGGDLALWVDPDAIAGSDNSELPATLGEQSPNAWTLTAHGYSANPRPTLQTSDVNGHNSVLFVGTGWLRTPPLGVTGDRFTVIHVWARADPDSSDDYWTSYNPNHTFSTTGDRWPSGYIHILASYDANPIGSGQYNTSETTPYADTGWHIIVDVLDGPDTFHRIDGSANRYGDPDDYGDGSDLSGASIENGVDIAWDGGVSGDNPYLPNVMEGRLAHFVVLNYVASPDEIQRWEGFLAHRFNIVLAEDHPYELEESPWEQRFRVIPSSVAVAVSAERTITASVAVSTPGLARTIPATVRISTPGLTRTIAPAAVVTVLGRTRTVAASTAVKVVDRTRTIPASVAIRVERQQSIGSTAALSIQATRTIAATAAVLTERASTVAATAHISTSNVARTVTSTVATLETHPRVVAGSVAITTEHPRTVASTVAIVETYDRTVAASTAVLIEGSRAIPATLHVSVSDVERFVVAEAAIQITGVEERTIAASAAISVANNVRSVGATVAVVVEQSVSVVASAAILQEMGRTIAADAAVQGAAERSIPATVAVRTERSQTIVTTASIQVTGTDARTIPADAAILTEAARTIGATVALSAEAVRTVPASAAVLIAATRTIAATTSVQIVTTATRTVATTASVATTVTRTVGATAALVVTTQRTIIASGSISEPAAGLTRTIASSVAVSVAAERILTATVALAESRVRLIVSSAVVGMRREQIIAATASVDLVAIVPSVPSVVAPVRPRVPLGAGGLPASGVAPRGGLIETGVGYPPFVVNAPEKKGPV